MCCPWKSIKIFSSMFGHGMAKTNVRRARQNLPRKNNRVIRACEVYVHCYRTEKLYGGTKKKHRFVRVYKGVRACTKLKKKIFFKWSNTRYNTCIIIAFIFSGVIHNCTFEMALRWKPSVRDRGCKTRYARETAIIIGPGWKAQLFFSAVDSWATIARARVPSSAFYPL